jgi:hypothetical protein
LRLGFAGDRLRRQQLLSALGADAALEIFDDEIGLGR